MAASTLHEKYPVMGVPPRMDLIWGRPLPSARGVIRWPTLTANRVNTTVHRTHNRKPGKSACGSITHFGVGEGVCVCVGDGECVVGGR